MLNWGLTGHSRNGFWKDIEPTLFYSNSQSIILCMLKRPWRWNVHMLKCACLWRWNLLPKCAEISPSLFLRQSPKMFRKLQCPAGITTIAMFKFLNIFFLRGLVFKPQPGQKPVFFFAILNSLFRFKLQNTAF